MPTKKISDKSTHKFSLFLTVLSGVFSIKKENLLKKEKNDFKQKSEFEKPGFLPGKKELHLFFTGK